MMIDRPLKPPRQGTSFQNNVVRSMEIAKTNYVTQSLVSTCIEFCKSTSLHGFHLIFQDFNDTTNAYLRRLQKFSSFIIWLVVVSFGATFCLYLMSLVWLRFQHSPTITSVENSNHPIWNVAFPAVTICNVNTVYKPRTENITKELTKKGFSPKEIGLFFQNLARLINFQPVDSQLMQIFHSLEELGYTSEKLMYELAQPCDNLIPVCSWLGKSRPCSSLFKVIKSAHGFCCSFNYKATPPIIDINNQKNYNHDEFNAPPIRVTGAGEDTGLRIYLDVESEHYVSARKSFFGAEIFIHDPDDFPDTSFTPVVGQPGQEIAIAILPAVIVTDESIKSLAVNLRFCIFEHERKLKSAETYGFSSCMTECRAETIIQKCGCLPFFYPETHSNGIPTKQCNLNDVKCLSDNKHVFLSLEPPPEMKKFFKDTNIGMKCDCLPGCNEQSYEFHALTTNRFDNKTFEALNYGNSTLSNTALIKIYFHATSCIKYRRDVFMSWDGLLASFGGIFGLCLGGSVVSLMELLYFVTFKLYSKLKLNKLKVTKERRQGDIQQNIISRIAVKTVDTKYRNEGDYAW